MLHVSVVFHDFAALRTLIAGVRASRANGIGQRTMPRNDLRTSSAKGGTIVTELHGFCMLRFAGR